MKGKKMKRKKIERRENKEKSRFSLYCYAWIERNNGKKEIRKKENEEKRE